MQPGRKVIGAGSTLDGGSRGSDTTGINEDDDVDDDDDGVFREDVNGVNHTFLDKV